MSISQRVQSVQGGMVLTTQQAQAHELFDDMADDCIDLKGIVFESTKKALCVPMQIRIE